MYGCGSDGKTPSTCLNKLTPKNFFEKEKIGNIANEKLLTAMVESTNLYENNIIIS